MIDFTIQRYKELLQTLINSNYQFQTFAEFIAKPEKKSIVLRHDVDVLPKNSLVFARIQASKGIKGTYYFRAVPQSWDEKIILEIASLGHEIGYHYECLTTTHGNLESGIEDFKTNLFALRKLVPVITICMHGSPMSKHDSKDLWKSYQYKDYGIIAEPYFDVDYNKVYYLTDTGRRWNGRKTSVRDRVNTNFTKKFRSTSEIIEDIDKGNFPNLVTMTFHPQRWNDNIIQWGKELVVQNIKNVIKRQFYVKDD
jgi:hypothetical protein